MSEFANLLLTYRLRARHPEHQGRLTQERLGQLIGEYLDDLGFSNVSIHNWETDKARISQSDRNVLVALLQALYQCQGIRTLAEANALLLAGDYRALNRAEMRQINADWLADAPDESPSTLPAVPTKNWARVQPYLPADLYQAVLNAPRGEQETLCRPHLAHLLRRVVTYVPRYIALDLLDTPRPAREQVNGRFLQGTLLFADISGFTALAEKMRQKAGKIGAEKIVELVNRFLEAMLRVLFKHDGELIQFGGDAMLCLFTGARSGAAASDAAASDAAASDAAPQEALQRGALSAVRAAWEMKQVMAAQFTQVEVLQEMVTLEVKVAQHSGVLFAATVGTAAHLEYFLTGSAVEYTAQAEAVAQQGEIVISATTHQLIAADVSAEPLAADHAFYRVTAVPHIDTSLLTNTWMAIDARLHELQTDVWEMAARLDALTPYLLSDILPQLVYNPVAPQLDGQHRQVTVLFANFLGASDIIAAYGPDQVARITADLDEYFRLMQEEAEYYGGVVNKVDLYDQGDKLMVTFGAPIAHERDARRAALAALAMQQALRRHSSLVARSRLSQRIGIHTGFAFAGNVGATGQNRHEYTVMGDTVNLAARIMSAAAPNQVWVSGTLWGQIAAEFEAQPLPPVTLPGVSDPQVLFHLQNARPGLARQRPQRPLHAALVGREVEMDRLMGYFDNWLFDASKWLVAVTGAGGVGKTRLVAEWRAKIAAVTEAHEAVQWVTGYGRSYGQRTHGVFLDVLEALLAVEPTDDQNTRWWKLSQALGALSNPADPGYEQQLQNRLAYLGYFLGWDLFQEPGLSERAAQLEGEALQLQMRLALCDLLQHAARQRPLLLVLEDLHWADADSLDLLQFVVSRLPDDLPILFCLLFRMQRQFPVWGTWHTLEQEYRDYCHLFELTELRPGDGRILLQNLLPGAQLPTDFQDLVLQATDGNPLYVEELLHAFIEDEVLLPTEAGWQLTRPVVDVQVPATLYQIIQSRIDDLDFSSPGARRVLWLAAVAGTSFTEDALRHLFQLTGRGETEFSQHLRTLRNADMVQRARVPVGVQMRPGYQFRHGLVQQVAYENMLARKRYEYHLRLANWLETSYAADLTHHYDALAHHFDQGQQWDKAFFYHWQVGARDARSYANASAQTHLQRALAVAGDASPAPTADELGQVRYELGKLLVIGGEYEMALALLQQAFADFAQENSDAAHRVQAAVCYEIGRVYENRGGRDNLAAALTWRDTGLGLLPALPSATLARLHALGGIVYLRLGDFDQCIATAEQALDIAEKAGAMGEMGFAHRLLSLAARHQSHPQEAMAHSQQCITLFTELNDLINLGREYANQGVFAFEMDEWGMAHSAYHKAVETLERVGDRYRLAMACCNLADLYAHRGEAETGLPYAQRGLAGFTRIGSQQGMVFAHCVLASLCWRQQSLPEARAHLQQAQSLVETQGIDIFRPMAGRWSVEVALAAGELERAEAELQVLLAYGDLADEAEPVQRLYGLLLAARGEWETAVQTLTAHLARVRQAGQRYQTGLAHWALARVLVQQSDQRPAAHDHARQAQRIFTELGAKANEADVLAFLATLEG